MRPSLMAMAAGAALCIAGCATPATPVPGVEQAKSLAGSFLANPDKAARDIIAGAHAAAGGEAWVRPQSLTLTGYNIIYAPGAPVIWDRYTMWRVYAGEKADAHAASGKVRIEGWSGESRAMLISFDGETTYNQDGPLPDQSGNAVWANSFGFGAIRNALDEGWSQARKPDRLIDGVPAYMVELTDPTGGKTLFGIGQSDARILYVGFNTPRGWHERYYSHFFTKPGVDWVQPGRVRLVYDGVKANEAVWTDFVVNADLADDVFVIGAN